MGTELVSACIFCAGLLLGSDLRPRDGLGAELGFSYATLARRYDVTENRVDGSDVTPKFLLIGMGNSWPAKDGLGAGTPASEWRVRIGFAASHDEQERKEDVDLERVLATGTGRYENFAVLARFGLGSRNSLEIGGERHSDKSTDLLNIGGENQEFSEQRSLTAERLDLALGWRHRWQGWEAEAAFCGTKVSGYNATANSFQQASGNLFGAQAEVRWRRSGWNVMLHGQAVGGSLDVHRESFPVFADRDSRQPASLAAVRLGVGYAWPRTEILLSTTYDRQHLPFIALAVLGTETVAFDSGFDPDSVTQEVFWDLAFRYAFSPAIRARVSVRLGWGDETVTLTDSAGVVPPRQLDVLRRGIFGGGLSGQIGAPEPTLLLGAEFAIGTPP